MIGFGRRRFNHSKRGDSSLSISILGFGYQRNLLKMNGAVPICKFNPLQRYLPNVSSRNLDYKLRFPQQGTIC